MTEEITVSITSQDVLSLRQSCQVIINEYKKYASSILVEDENGVYPMILDQVKGLRVDVEAGSDTLDSFDGLTLEENKKPTSNMGDLNSFKEIDQISGNFSVTQSIHDDAQDKVKKLFDGMKHREVKTVSGTGGSDFRSDFNSAETTEEYSSKKYSQSIPSPAVEDTNTGETADRPVQDPPAEQGLSNITGQTASHTTQSKGKYQNVISEDCIPCSLRLNNLDALDPSLGLLSALEDMVARYKKLISDLEGLLTNTDIANDICSLLNFLNFQCLPDLFSIIALLSALMQKYSDIIPNLDGAFMQFIGPFFSPLLSGLTGLLDQYMQVIMQPVDCVLTALDTQLSKLDGAKALDQASIRNVSFHRKREGYLRRKMEDLEERKSYLRGVMSDSSNPYGEDSVPPQKIGGYKTFTEVDITTKINAANPGYLTIKDEISNIDEEIASISADYNKEYGPAGTNNIEKLVGESQNPTPSSLRAMAEAPGKAKDALSSFSNSLGSGLQELRGQILNGKRMINGTLRVMREELQRLIMGRAATSEEMIEGARNIQKIARLIGLVGTLIQLAKVGDLCQNSNEDPSVALGSFLTANRGDEYSKPYYDVYSGEDENGDNSLLIAPADAVLELTDPEGGGIKQLNDLSEIRKLNNDGLPKHLGNIADKKIEATIPDLGIQAPVSIMAFDLCQKTTSSTRAEITDIQEWAVNAGLKI